MLSISAPMLLNLVCSMKIVLKSNLLNLKINMILNCWISFRFSSVSVLSYLLYCDINMIKRWSSQHNLQMLPWLDLLTLGKCWNPIKVMMLRLSLLSVQRNTSGKQTWLCLFLILVARHHVNAHAIEWICEICYEVMIVWVCSEVYESLIRATIWHNISCFFCINASKRNSVFNIELCCNS